MSKYPLIVQIGSIDHTLSPGGISSYFNSVVEYLQYLHCPVIHIEIGERSGIKGKRIYFSESRQHWFIRMLLMRYLLKQITKKYSNIVFVSHYLPNIFLSLDILLKNSFVYHFHGSAYLEAKAENKNKFYQYILKRIECLLYAQFSKIIVLSDYMRQILIEHYHVKREKIFVVPFSINAKKLEIEKITIRRNKDLQKYPIKICCVRRLHYRMGIVNLIRAVELLLKDGYQLELLVIGQGPLYSKLDTYIKQHQLSSSIKLLGKISEQDLEIHLTSSLFSVLPTLSLEGFGIAIIDSLKYGIPCLATNVGGIPEVLGKIDKKLIINGNDPGSIYQHIKYFLDHQSELPTTEAILTGLKNNFSWDLNYRSLLNIYYD